MKLTSAKSVLDSPTPIQAHTYPISAKPLPAKAPPAKSQRLPYPIILSLALSTMLLWQAPLQAANQDDEIEAAAQSSYVFKTFLIDESIRTESKDGVVTLTGAVTADSHKYLAENTVASLSGVKSVVNQITVKEGAAEYSDTWLYWKVKSALAMHRSLSVFSTQVVIKEGVVTLKGEASSQAQKELAAEYAKDVEGIKGVNNEMTVATMPLKPAQSFGEVVDDASITAQVRVALLMHRSTSALATHVSTLAGVVTVGGKAANLAEKDLVTKLVIDINGVKSVINEMTVEPTVSKQ